MQRTVQTIAAFWPAGVLVALVFSTMIEPMRTGIEHLGIGGYLLRWAVAVAPSPLLYWLSGRMGTPAVRH